MTGTLLLLAPWLAPGCHDDDAHDAAAGDAVGMDGQLDGGGSGGVGGTDGAAGAGGTGGSDGGGGTDGGGGADGGGDGGMGVKGCAAGIKFCDDFESYPVGSKPPGKAWKGCCGALEATFAVDATRAFSGGKSLKFVAPDGTSTGGIEIGSPLLPFPDNKVFVRMMVYSANLPTGNDNFRPGFARSAAGFYSFGACTGGCTDPGKGRMFCNIANETECNEISDTMWPVGRWACIQFMADGSPDAKGGTKDEARLWLDGVEITDAAIIKGVTGCNRAAPTFDRVQMGWSNSGDSGTTVEMWIDDWAIDDKPIPCAGP